MTTDWIATLHEQGEIAKRMAKGIPEALAHPNLTIDQASRLYTAVERGAQSFDAVVDRMQEEDLDDALYEAAEALEDIWSQLSVATANKVRTMRGLPPIELPPEEDD